MRLTFPHCPPPPSNNTAFRLRPPPLPPSAQTCGSPAVLLDTPCVSCHWSISHDDIQHVALLPDLPLPPLVLSRHSCGPHCPAGGLWSRRSQGAAAVWTGVACGGCEARTPAGEPGGWAAGAPGTFYAPEGLSRCPLGRCGCNWLSLASMGTEGVEVEAGKTSLESPRGSCKR